MRRARHVQQPVRALEIVVIDQSSVLPRSGRQAVDYMRVKLINGYRGQFSIRSSVSIHFF
jgi:hypothetical protein